MKYILLLLFCAFYAIGSNLQPEESSTEEKKVVVLSDFEQVTAVVILLDEYKELTTEQKLAHYSAALDSFAISHEEYQNYLREQKNDISAWYSTVDRIYNALFQEK